MLLAHLEGKYTTDTQIDCPKQGVRSLKLHDHYSDHYNYVVAASYPRTRLDKTADFHAHWQATPTPVQQPPQATQATDACIGRLSWLSVGYHDHLDTFSEFI